MLWKVLPRLDSKEQFNLEDDSSFSSSDDMGESLNLQEIDLVLKTMQQNMMSVPVLLL